MRFTVTFYGHFFLLKLFFMVVVVVLQSIYQPLPLPFLLTPKLALTKSVSQPPSHPSCPCVTSKSPTSESPLDFSAPAEFIPCLDTSAARHRVSIKPRNQRPSTKKSVHTVSKHIIRLICYAGKQKRRLV